MVTQAVVILDGYSDRLLSYFAILAMRRKTAKGVVACELISEEPALDESMDDSVISSTPADIDLAEIPIATADAPDITAESPSQAAGPSSKKKPRRKRGRRSRSGSKSAKRTKH